MSAPLEGFYFSRSLDISLKGLALNVNFQEGVALNAFFVLSRKVKAFLILSSL